MTPEEFDAQVKLAVYRHFAETGVSPSPEAIADAWVQTLKVSSTLTAG